MKMRAVLALAVTVFGLAGAASPVFAEHDGTFSAYPVGADGSTVQKDVFGWDETPFIYLHLPNPGTNFASTLWSSPSGGSPHLATGGPGADTEYWLYLSNWNAVRALGVWDVSAGYLYSQPFDAGGAPTSFTVTPEPATAALFLIGGLTLAAVGRKRKSSPSA